MSQQIVLFGAGAAGHYALKHLRSQGIEPLCFADNNKKFGEEIDGVIIGLPETVKQQYPDATWVACAISRPAATEIRTQMKSMDVETKPLWECIPVHHGLPSALVFDSIYRLVRDAESKQELLNQRVFRESPDYDEQRDPSLISELYFPDFICMLQDEHFVDCGAADGDTIRAYLDKIKCSPAYISAFEPDNRNFCKLYRQYGQLPNISLYENAVLDREGEVSFENAGDYSSHIGGQDVVNGAKLDEVNFPIPPTYIKMDVEGAELEAIWGARKLLKEHSPVLAICAYHTSDHLWEIPLLIHAIQPEYKLYFRRYGEGAFEIVWYGVPPERVK